MSKTRHFLRNSLYTVVPKKFAPLVFPVARRCYIELKQFKIHGCKNIPFAVNIETNDSCTRKCSYCPRPASKDMQLSYKTFQSIIDQLSDWGFRGRLSPHSYNEPLTDERLVKFLVMPGKNYLNLNLL